jgi:hypothetical protein
MHTRCISQPHALSLTATATSIARALHQRHVTCLLLVDVLVAMHAFGGHALLKVRTLHLKLRHATCLLVETLTSLLSCIRWSCPSDVRVRVPSSTEHDVLLARKDVCA